MLARLCGAVGVLVLVATLAFATTARLMLHQDLAAEADVVVIGDCVSIRSAWVDQTLVTEATIRVTENLRGSGDLIRVVLPGGIDANRPVPVQMSYPGAPRITPGEEVFLFLEDETVSLGGYTVLGFSQGKFSIVSDPQGRKFVERDLTTLDLQSGAGVSRGTRSLTSLKEFKEEIQKHLSSR